MITIIVCSVIAIIGLMLLIIGIISKEDGSSVIGGVILALVGFLGFGMIACVLPYSEKHEKVESFTYAKTKYSVIIETPKLTQTFTDAYTYNAINDSSEVFYNTLYNAYGSETHRTITLNADKQN